MACKREGRKPPINDPDDVAAIQAKIDAYFDGLRVLTIGRERQNRLHLVALL